MNQPPHGPPDAMVQAVRHHQAGRLKEAERLYRKLLQDFPGHPEVLRMLGLADLQLGRFGDAVRFLNAAVQVDPDRPDSHAQLGAALAGLNRFEEAISHFHTALSLAPDQLETLVQLGMAQHQAGRNADAVESLAKAVRLAPGQPQLHYNLGIMQRAAGQLDNALASYQQAVRLAPDFAEAHYNLGNLYQDMGMFAESESAFRAAIAARPELAQAHDNLGNTLIALGRADEALAAYDQSLIHRPGHPKTISNRAGALAEAGRLAEAAKAYRLAIKKDPSLDESRSLLVHTLQKMCDWDALERLEKDVLASLKTGTGTVRPFPLLAMASSTPADLLRCARAHIEAEVGDMAPAFSHSPQQRADSRPPLTIGYLSADFRRHPVAYLMADLLAHHNRQRVQVIAYSYGRNDNSAIRARIAEGADQFVDIAPLSHRASAQRIYDDRVDILVDLMGHTKGTRLAIMAQRPAPIQLSMLGYAGTTGADFIDYIVADSTVLPRESEAYYTEAPLRLPHCFMPNTRSHPTPNPALTRADFGLPEYGTVFCSFNASYKIAPSMFGRWMNILHQVSGSVLWLSLPNPVARKNLSREAEQQGIDPSRLIFADKLPAVEDHLARYRVADLFLDALPYNAHATTSDALWAGCPVLTCLGQGFQSRVAGSLLSAIGLDELITDNLDEYETVAVALGSHPERLQALRQELEQRRETAPLFDTERYVRHLEAGFEAIRQRHQEGLPPTPIDIT